jgi:hydrogenase expression/formation protein HypC
MRGQCREERKLMCISLPGKVLRLNGAMAEVEISGRQLWCNALAQPEVKVGDYILVHANLIVAIISEQEAQQMFQTARELDEALERERAGDHSVGDNSAVKEYSMTAEE